MAVKRIWDDTIATIHGANFDNKVADTARKKCKGCFNYRVPFKSEWTDFHPVKAIKSEKQTFHSQTWKKSVS